MNESFKNLFVKALIKAAMETLKEAEKALDKQKPAPSKKK